MGLRERLDDTYLVVEASSVPCEICGKTEEHTHTNREIPDEMLVADILDEYQELKQTEEGRKLLLSVYGFPLWEFDAERETNVVFAFAWASLKE